MTGFHEVRFPDAVARGATGGPAYSTAVVSFGGGFESRNQNWALARGRCDISTGIRTRAQMDEVIAFFRARKGRAHGFRFKDWQDFQAVDQPLAATADVPADTADQHCSGVSLALPRPSKQYEKSKQIRLQWQSSPSSKLNEDLSGPPSPWPNSARHTWPSELRVASGVAPPCLSCSRSCARQPS